MINQALYPVSPYIHPGLLGATAPAAAQLAPQGIFGSLVGAIAPTVAGTIGGWLGHPNIGAQVGNVIGKVAPLIPLSAGPQFATQLAPQGVFGDLIGHFAPTVGGAIGGLVGHPNIGTQIGTAVSGLSGLIPFSAGPQFAPQGVFGDMVSHAGSALSSLVHSPIAGAIAQAAPGIATGAGYPTVGSVLSVLTGQLGDHPVGAALSKLAPLLGAKAAETFGHPALGTLGNLAGQGAALLPFAAGPSFIQARY